MPEQLLSDWAGDDDVVVAPGPITVTATVTYEYDPRDGLVLNTKAAEKDVCQLLDSGRLTSGDFTITTSVKEN